MENILITICARGGSKGIPGKNIKIIGGKPLIAYSIFTANKLKKMLSANVYIVLSTDDCQIKQVAKEYGLETDYTRQDEFATDTAGKLPVVKDILVYAEKLKNTNYHVIIDLAVTSPMRTIVDVKKALDILINDEMALNIFTVNKAARNPYFNMVEQKKNGYYNLVKNLGDAIKSRQKAPKVYDMNASFYIYRRKFFNMEYKTAITYRSLIYEMPHICFDLDHSIDFEFMEYLINNKKLGFDLI